MSEKYIVKKTVGSPNIANSHDSNDWSNAEILEVSNFLPESSDHRPETVCRMLYNENGLYGLFEVKDQYVRAVNNGYQASVCRDSCVEFFVRPKPDKGYLNFEFNCGGSLLCYYITDNTRTENGFKEFTPVNIEDLKKVEIFHSMPKTVEPEITEPIEWRIGFHIPFSLFANYVKDFEYPEGKTWTANFYKCGDQTSHPHWASWNPVSKLNFHLPECFGEIEFQKI